MHCPHIRQSQMASFVPRSTKRRAFRNPRARAAVAGGLRSSFVVIRASERGGVGRYLRGAAGTSFLGSMNGMAAVLPVNGPASDWTSRTVPGRESSTGTHT